MSIGLTTGADRVAAPRDPAAAEIVTSDLGYFVGYRIAKACYDPR